MTNVSRRENTRTDRDVAIVASSTPSTTSTNNDAVDVTADGVESFETTRLANADGFDEDALSRSPRPAVARSCSTMQRLGGIAR